MHFGPKHSIILTTEERIAVAQLAGYQPGNHEVPGLVPGFNSPAAAVFPWARNFTLAPATQLLNRDILSLYVAGHSWRTAYGWSCYPCKNNMSKKVSVNCSYSFTNSCIRLTALLEYLDLQMVVATVAAYTMLSWLLFLN